MYLETIFLGGLLFAGRAAATPAELQNRATACRGDNLYRCFTASTAQASEFCSKFLTWPAAATQTVSIIPTVTLTSIVTITGDPPAAQRLSKRAATTKPLLCTTYEDARLTSACSCLGITVNVYSETVTVAPVTVPVEVICYVPAATTSPTGDSCSSVTTLTETVTNTETQVQTKSSSYAVISATTVTQTEVQTATQTEISSTQITSVVTEVQTTQIISLVTEVQTTQIISTVTEIQTQTQTETKTDTSSTQVVSTVTEIQTQTQTETKTDTSSTQVVSTVTEIQTETQTQISSVTSTATPSASDCPAAPVPLLKNGNFESGNYDGWSVVSSAGGASVSVISGGVGGSKALDIATSYFAQSTLSSAVVTQTINCVRGNTYRLSLNYAVVSSYVNGNPWSIVVNGATVASGAGSATSWSSLVNNAFTCGANGALLELRMQSNTNRAAHLQIDNVDIYPLNVPN